MSATSPVASDAALAARITFNASKQTYYTVRFLVDRGRVDDAYRAYAYFRWVDDTLDGGGLSRAQRLEFVARQRALMEMAYAGQRLPDLTPEERLLADLVARDRAPGSGLQAYIRNMMAVMVFDAQRRGRPTLQRELDDYVSWLATAVTEALHYFIGAGAASPHDERRYLAAAGAHMTHMLRDAVEDAEAGYYNLPREVMAARGLSRREWESGAYRHWVKGRVQQTRACFRAGRDYLAQVKCLRCRLAGYAYILRFEGVLDAVQREGYRLRADYPERKSPGQQLKMLGGALWMALGYRPAARPAPAPALSPSRAGR
jgi:phytoene/squalene synthetase